MNDLQRSTKADSELRDTSTHPRGAQRSRKVAIGLLATIIVLAMLAWLAFLGWGTITLWRGVFTH
jgi:hypothetical protein